MPRSHSFNVQDDLLRGIVLVGWEKIMNQNKYAPVLLENSGQVKDIVIYLTITEVCILPQAVERKSQF